MTKYFEIVEKMEPTVSATPMLATLLHGMHKTSPCSGGTRRMHVQPTAVQRRRPRGSQKAPQGRPMKRKCNENTSYQPKRGKPEHMKKRRHLSSNERLNQTNYFKH